VELRGRHGVMRETGDIAGVAEVRAEQLSVGGKTRKRAFAGRAGGARVGAGEPPYSFSK
jgi:hypothetical protein